MAAILSAFRNRGGALGRLGRAASTAVPSRPIDLQSSGFLDIRNNNCAFVDKTSPIADLLASRSSKRAFLSRPRRYGKSTTIGITAEMLAAGDLPEGVEAWPGYAPVPVDAVFGGLEAHNRFLRKDPSLGQLFRQPHFVIKLALGGTHTGSVLMQRVIVAIAAVAGSAFGPELEAKVLACPTADAALEALIRAVPRGVPIAVLVDEYDAPIIADVSRHRWSEAEDGVAALRSLLMTSKAPELDQRITHFIVTGVARLASVSLFSGANNFMDLTTTPIASRVLGFSEQEIRETFPAELVRLGEGMGISAASEEELRDAAMEELARNYNGYCFDGQTSCFNPTPVLASLSAGKLTGMEMEGASGYDWLGLAPSKVLEELSRGGAQLSSVTADIADLRSGAVDVSALLLQTGLLTQKPAPPHTAPASPPLALSTPPSPVMLHPPNQYARKAILALASRALMRDKAAALMCAAKMGLAGERITAALAARDHEAFAQCLRESFAIIAGSTVNTRGSGEPPSPAAAAAAEKKGRGRPQAASTIKKTAATPPEAAAAPAAGGEEGKASPLLESPYHTFLQGLLHGGVPADVCLVVSERAAGTGVADLVLHLRASPTQQPAVWILEVGRRPAAPARKLAQAKGYYCPQHAASHGAVFAVVAGGKQAPAVVSAVWDVAQQQWASSETASQ